MKLKDKFDGNQRRAVDSTPRNRTQDKQKTIDQIQNALEGRGCSIAPKSALQGQATSTYQMPEKTRPAPMPKDLHSQIRSKYKHLNTLCLNSSIHCEYQGRTTCCCWPHSEEITSQSTLSKTKSVVASSSQTQTFKFHVFPIGFQRAGSIHAIMVDLQRRNATSERRIR